MAELLIVTHSNSNARKFAVNTINVLFPIWGVLSPVMIVINGGKILYESGNTSQTTSWVVLVLWAVMTVGSLLAKVILSSDEIAVDPSGVRMPFLVGDSLNFLPKIRWSDVTSISAITRKDTLQSSTISFKMKNGLVANYSLKSFTPEFVEQFLLAAKMWAPSVCDQSLDELQQLTRRETSDATQQSFTELWEEELERRFSPTAYSMMEPGAQLQSGALKVVRYLASGGLSALYLAQQSGQRLVVLKEAVVPPNSTEALAEKAKQMFEREAQLLMKLDHPGIVHVLDHFCENGRNYLLLEYVNGTDLRQRVLQNGVPSVNEVLEWATQVAVSLKYLHDREQPIVHRDVTPDNIVLRNSGEAVLVDFGAANEFIGTATGTFVGKHSYVAPEQLRGKATTQSDIYAFGCTMYFLLTGEEPEALSNSDPRSLRPDLPEELADIVATCTKLEAKERYQSFGHIIPALKRLTNQTLQVL